MDIWRSMELYGRFSDFLMIEAVDLHTCIAYKVLAEMGDLVFVAQDESSTRLTV